MIRFISLFSGITKFDAMRFFMNYVFPLSISLLLISVGLKAQQIPGSVMRFHQKAILIDTHNDVLSTLTLEGKDISRRLHEGNTDLPRLKEGGVDAQFFSIWCDGSYGKGTAFKYANREIDSLMSIIHRNPGKIALARNYEDIMEDVHEGKIAALIGVEGGHMIEGRLDYLDSLYRRGMRYMTLTWNNSTDWSTSAADETRHPDALKHLGLTAFGKKVVRHMNRLGVMVDLAHVGERTFFDAIQTSSKPVLVSHSCVYAICPVSRNLKDSQIRAVKKNGGVICVNFYSGFVDPNYFKKINALKKKYAHLTDSLKARHVQFIDGAILKLVPKAEVEALRPPLSLLIDHIDYIVKLIGVDYVGIGSDFDGAESYPEGLDDVTDYPKITEALLKRGYSKEDVEKILGGNVLRVIKANMN